MEADHVYYCDDAVSKIVIAKNLGRPYDLLITDLYFDEDSQTQKITNGVDLIKVVRTLQPDLRIIVFTAENKSAILDNLFNHLQIDGYVRKARNDSRQLKTAIDELRQNRRFIPRLPSKLTNQKRVHDFSTYDITIISLLAQGMSQKHIPSYLEKNKIAPASLSAIEKRLKQMKTALDFTKNEQLVAFCKDMGII